MDKHEVILILTQMRDDLQHNYKLYQQPLEMQDRGRILAAMKQKISALQFAITALE